MLNIIIITELKKYSSSFTQILCIYCIQSYEIRKTKRLPSCFWRVCPVNSKRNNEFGIWNRTGWCWTVGCCKYFDSLGSATEIFIYAHRKVGGENGSGRRYGFCTPPSSRGRATLVRMAESYMTIKLSYYFRFKLMVIVPYLVRDYY